MTSLSTRLWAPWRREYHAAPKNRGCLFCRAARSKDSRAQMVVFRSRRVYAMLNKYPYNAGHLLIAVNRHVADLSQLTELETVELMAVAQRMITQLKKLIAPKGFNVGINLGRAAGAGIPKHLHLHVVPRWVGDSNFMPVIGRTKVMPVALEALYEGLTR